MVKPFVCLMLVFLLAGCMGSDKERLEEDNIYQLKVLYWDKDGFYSKYGNYLLNEFPNIEFDIVPLKQVYASGTPPEQELMKLVDSEKPDLLFLNINQYQALQKKQELLPLKNLLGDKVFSSLPQGVLDLQQFYGDEDVYGIGTSFNSSVLFYNRDLFERYGVSLPAEEMDWESFALLAQRFPPDRILGLYSASPEPSALLTSIGVSEGLSYLSTDGTKVNFNTDSWARLAEIVKTLYEKKVMNSWDSSYDMANTPFMKGEAAMTIGDYSLFRLLEERNLPFKWGVSPLPGSDPTRSAMNLEQLVSIDKNSENAEVASRLVEYLFSEKMIKMLDRTNNSLTASLYSSASTDEGHPFHFLYNRRANLNALASYMRVDETSDAFKEGFSGFYSEMMRKIVGNEVEVKDGLAQIEAYGNSLIAR